MPGRERKHSGKRDAILRVIRSTGSHPSAQWVYEQLRPAIPGLSLATVYRNISLFREEGELASVGVLKGEERFDGRTEAHPHFICSRCGRIIDMDGLSNETLEHIAALGMAESLPDLRIDARRTVFYGLCGDCRKTVERRETGGS
ncbi:MAG: transcriptional repressor [Treponema sp.]|nr:transcriptional repressor [Treponema sp.]